MRNFQGMIFIYTQTYREIFKSALVYLYVVGQLMRQLVYTSLLLIITLRFTCGERKIFSTIRKSQNIMKMIVELCKCQRVCYIHNFADRNFQKVKDQCILQENKGLQLIALVI